MKKIILRIILSPIIFLWGLFMLAAGTLFPLPLLVGISIFGLIAMPFVWLLRKGGSDIECFDPFIDSFKSNSLNHLAGATIYLWGAFAVAFLYVKTGKIFTGE